MNRILMRFVVLKFGPRFKCNHFSWIHLIFLMGIYKASKSLASLFPFKFNNFSQHQRIWQKRKRKKLLAAEWKQKSSISLWRALERTQNNKKHLPFTTTKNLSVITILRYISRNNRFLNYPTEFLIFFGFNSKLFPGTCFPINLISLETWFTSVSGKAVEATKFDRVKNK